MANQGADRQDAEDRALTPASTSEPADEGSPPLAAAVADEAAPSASPAPGPDAAPDPTSADTGAESAGSATPAPGVEVAPDAAPKPEPARRRASRLWWALPILMLVEFYVYGHDGRLEICVGKEGDTDFSLVGQERTDANRWKFPRCETRENLGLRSHEDERAKEGIEAACRGATIFRHQGEAKACIAGENGWQHRVEGHFVYPWEPAYYRHLFWFLQ